MSKQLRMFEDRHQDAPQRRTRPRKQFSRKYYLISENGRLMRSVDPYTGQGVWIPRDESSPRIVLYFDALIADRDARQIGACVAEYTGGTWSHI